MLVQNLPGQQLWKCVILSLHTHTPFVFLSLCRDPLFPGAGTLTHFLLVGVVLEKGG